MKNNVEGFYNNLNKAINKNTANLCETVDILKQIWFGNDAELMRIINIWNKTRENINI